MMSTGRTPLLLLFFNLIIFSAAGKRNGVCISQGGRFAPFSSEGKPPSKVTKGPKDLTLCRVFRKRTCCDVAQTHPALLTIRRLASAGEASQECLQLIFEACAGAYFSEDVKTQVLSPCGLNDFVCGRVSEWASNGTELCKFAGFAIKSSEDNYGAGIEPSCYGGKASLDSIADSWKTSRPADSWKTSRPGVPRRGQKLGSFQDFQQWVRQMPINERVSWAVGGMVLTAGLLFVRSTKGEVRATFVHKEPFQEQEEDWTAGRVCSHLPSPANKKQIG
ncbi:hypothetical protein C5167_043322 [Papaver somniferum]|uniref:Folate receptor-like domain-containing protein n=1 Tax=Papaver somniferum TaxID=3469 RepID=A0A4Y7L7Z6_PAPSO|nr:hypothetical protein C5167_043322 [Papaver somniferum]